MSEKLGKIEHHLIEQLISTKCGYQRNEVIAGAQFGVDVSVIDLPGDVALALTSDPLSLIPSLGLQESAWLSVHLMANDMATTGYAPMYGQFVLNLPSSFSKNDFKVYWEYIHKFCSEIKIAITGGHTGFIEGQNSSIAGGGTLVTVAPKNKILLSKSAKSGNAILVTKSCAISSAAILAMSFPETVKKKAGIEIFQYACNSFYHTSSLQDALIAVGENNEYSNVTAMHDVTEGGVLGAIYELAIASNNGAVIYNNKLPIAEVQAEICTIFGLDPRYCIGAGSMIITCEKEASDEVVARLAKRNIPCVEVGELCEKKNGITLVENDEKSDLKYFEEDPYWAAFFNALKEGWK
ncbi:AIR synthase family protein [Ferruginibacter paludis]|uniref:AIR synthase family protein n=1 Tax=Ferruginibacter paludis TaxID=1310417 RepID=UPI0025B5D55D|nr:AIR synthase family protein [Ferruginibacter paludis]MDN3657224.1 AIR synthase family protein [Ferruginibacter paludis]